MELQRACRGMLEGWWQLCSESRRSTRHSELRLTAESLASVTRVSLAPVLARPASAYSAIRSGWWGRSTAARLVGFGHSVGAHE